jgi:hypothetical protein
MLSSVWSGQHDSHENLNEHDAFSEGTEYASHDPEEAQFCDNPISKFWDQDIDGTCLDQASIIMADAVVSVVSDDDDSRDVVGQHDSHENLNEHDAFSEGTEYASHDPRSSWLMLSSVWSVI